MALNIGIGVKSVVSCIQKGGLLNRVFTQRGLAWTSSLWHAENGKILLENIARTDVDLSARASRPNIRRRG